MREALHQERVVDHLQFCGNIFGVLDGQRGLELTELHAERIVHGVFEEDVHQLGRAREIGLQFILEFPVLRTVDQVADDGETGPFHIESGIVELVVKAESRLQIPAGLDVVDPGRLRQQMGEAYRRAEQRKCQK